MDGSSLAAYRILFGLIMAFAMVRFLAKGYVKTLFLDPAFHFPCAPWIQPWPGIGMYIHVAILGVCALGLAMGFYFRCCTALFCLGFTYLQLIDRTTYLNHYYLVSLLAGLLVFLPAHRQWSLDALRHPPPPAAAVPAWTIWVLRLELGLVYVFAGASKLSADWLVAGQPMRTWLAANGWLPLVGPWLTEPWVAYAAGWLAMVFDLSVPFLLLNSRTRPFAYGTLVLFHVITSLLFPIGIFPWLMIAAMLIFFPPDWARRLGSRLAGGEKADNHGWRGSRARDTERW